MDLIDQAKQELESLEFGTEQYTFLRNLITQHQLLLNDYLISTSAYQTAGLIGLDVILLAPGVLTKIATPFSRLCIASKLVAEASTRAAGELVGDSP